jgi:hypothetical protein
MIYKYINDGMVENCLNLDCMINYFVLDLGCNWIVGINLMYY